MNKLSAAKRVQILNLLCEGDSHAGDLPLKVSFNTVSKLLADAGKDCAAFHAECDRLGGEAGPGGRNLELCLSQAEKRRAGEGGSRRRRRHMDVDGY